MSWWRKETPNLFGACLSLLMSRTGTGDGCSFLLSATSLRLEDSSNKSKFHDPSAPCRPVPSWREHPNQHRQFAHTVSPIGAPGAPRPVQRGPARIDWHIVIAHSLFIFDRIISVWSARVSPFLSACPATVPRPRLHAAVAYFGVSPLLHTWAHLPCKSPPVVSGFPHRTRSWTIRAVSPALTWSRTVESGPSTAERLSSLDSTRTSET